MKLISSSLESLLGLLLNRSIVFRYVLPPETCQSHLVTAGLKGLDERSALTETNQVADENSLESPVFILSAGWGSGSTLLQRLVLSSNEVMVWGESYDQAAPVQRLAMTISPFRTDWPPDYHFNPEFDLENLSKSWVANLAPPIGDYKQAHLEFFNAWLGNEKVKETSTRWGLKEVRLTIDHARYLKWLYPNAKFIFIYRDLHSCYRSCRKLDWFSVWPGFKATGIVAFAHHWKYLLEGYIKHHKDVGGLLLSYEDLTKNTDALETIRKYINVEKIDTDILQDKLGSIGGGSRGEQKNPLRLYEKWILNSIAGKLRNRLGYD